MDACAGNWVQTSSLRVELIKASRHVSGKDDASGNMGASLELVENHHCGIGVAPGGVAPGGVA